MGFTGRLTVGAGVVCLAAIGVARAESVEVALPFLADDASFESDAVAAPLWPECVPGVAGERPGFEVAGVAERPGFLIRTAPAFPDVADLLEPFGATLADHHDRVRFDDATPQAARIRRLLAAVEAGYARDLQIEIAVVRVPAGSAVDADACLAGSTPSLVRFVTTTRAGAVVTLDERVAETWPAGSSVSSHASKPVPVVIRTGPRAVCAVTPVGDLGDGRFVVDLALHVVTPVGERTFDGPARRVAPRLDVIALHAQLPLVEGHPTVARLAGAAVVVRVARTPSAALDGVRALPLPSGRIADATPTLVRRRALLAEEDADDDGAGRRGIPDAWQAAARECGVRLVEVPPALAIAEGDEEALVRFDARIATLRETDAHLLTDAATGLSLALAGAAPATFAVGHVDPVAVEIETEIAMENAVAAASLEWEPSGTFVHVARDGALPVVGVVVREVSDAATRVVASTPAAPLADPTNTTFDAWRMATETRQFTPTEDGDSTWRSIEGWR